MIQILTEINGIQIRRNFLLNLPYNPELKKYVAQKRKAGILTEVLFWREVRARKFHTIDFDRQRIIGNYIVDFYVKTLGLVIEIEGSCMGDLKSYDVVPEKYLEYFGLKIYKITDFDIKNNLTTVMKDLEQFIISHYSYHPVKN